MIASALSLHVLAAVMWVGGMAFAWAVLRPAAGEVLDPAARQQVWRAVFARFFPLVWVAIVLLLATGYTIIFLAYGGFARAGAHIHIMQLIGIVMMLLFAHLYFAPWRRFRRAVDAGDTAAAGRQLDTIRRIVQVNLILGIVTVLIASGGRYWPI